MNIRIAVLCAALLGSAGSFAFEQEETYTDLTPGKDMLDPGRLSMLLQQNDVRAMNNIALLWAKGYDGKQSFDEAMKWWKEAAKRGYTVAMNNIGLLYANGDGVKQDYAEAFNWWHQSAFLGNAWAMNSVGDLYENGMGVPRNLLMAMTWYQSAAAQGEPMGMYNVGLLFESGSGVDKDDAEALAWFRKSAERGYASAMHSIGKMYAEGRGVPADPVEGLAWYTVADTRYPPEDAVEAKANRRDIEQLSSQLGEAGVQNAKARAAAIDTLTKPAKAEPPKPLQPGERST
ncbi:MAG TPA: tetratricopeptide repeat protein [Burkholderiales bacterium]|nr:tetratricopeptide repeat protein [Burkholderiales bacterium]